MKGECQESAWKVCISRNLSLQTEVPLCLLSLAPKAALCLGALTSRPLFCTFTAYRCYDPLPKRWCHRELSRKPAWGPHSALSDAQLRGSIYCYTHEKFCERINIKFISGKRRGCKGEAVCQLPQAPGGSRAGAGSCLAQSTSDTRC